MLLCYELLDKLVYWNGHIVKRDMYKGKKRAIRFHVHVCKNCEEEFLSYNKESKFCGNSCTAKFTHNNRTKAEKARFKRKISDTKKKNPKPAWNKRSFDYAIYDTYVKWIGWIDKTRRNEKETQALETVCTYCGKWFIPTLKEMKSRVNALSKGVDRNKLYCSDGCKSECPVFNKHSNVISTKQNTSREVNTYLRQLVLKRDGYKCIKCKSEERLHCHHILPLNESPIESADVDNCIALCKVCHKKIHMTVGCKYNELKCN